MDNPTKVLNKAPAPIQISAEQLLREAHERKDAPFKRPTQRITDPAELADYQFRKRKQFEDIVRVDRHKFGVWVQYAQWEAEQRDFERARSVFERALVIDPRAETVWMRYVEMEMKNKFVQHARNVFDRAVTLLPRVDQFWYKYAYMEEMLGNVAAARQIFERWMEWEPSESAWNLFIKLELRYHETDRARKIYERFVAVHPDSKNWMKWAKFEEDQGSLENARNVYQHAVEFLGEQFVDQHILVSFARFETRHKEFERARVIYQYALKTLPPEKLVSVQNNYTQFEKQFGGRDEVEDLVRKKQREQYQRAVEDNPHDYDSWFDWIRLEENAVLDKNDTAQIDKTRDVYERAIAQLPPVVEKKYWRRYIYLWINYALFEEIVAEDISRTREVYKQCLNIIPHKKFTFAKIWLMYAQFEIRQMDLSLARKILGRGIGMCPKNKLFKGYIELEMQLREFDRCRKLYEQFIKFLPANTYAWIKYAQLEALLDDSDRTRGIFELAIGQPMLDMPEMVWKAFIDYEYDMADWQRVRALYRRLLKKTHHPRVWNAFADFEYDVACKVTNEDGDRVEDPDKVTDGVSAARKVFEEGYTVMKENDLKEERRLFLTTWMEFERDHGNDTDMISTLERKLPQQIKKRRRLNPYDEEDDTWEEYIELRFPEDEESDVKKSGGVAKLMAMAKQWKEKQAALERE